MAKERITVSIDSDLIERLDAARNRIPRSTMFNQVLEYGLEKVEGIKVA